jgi:hypothetical protein
MLPDASRDRRSRSIVFAGLRPALASALLSSALLASPQPARVLLVVPPGADLAGIDRARSAVPPSHAVLLVAASDRVRVKGGLEVLADFPFPKAPAADLVVLLAGEPGQAEEAFLLERRNAARAVLLPPGSPIAERLRGAAGGALILLGGSEAIAAVLEGLDRTTEDERAAPRPTAVAEPPPRAAPPTPAVPPTPAATPTRAGTGRVFDRYFSASRPTPTPSPTPR